MVKRDKLTLRKQPPADPVKIAQSLEMGVRFVDRAGRYILQKYVVTYEGRRCIRGGATAVETVVSDSTWVDIPLVPETYGEAKA